MFEILPRNFVEKPWGRADLPCPFAQDHLRVGEIWYDRAGASLPILAKWLFTSERLSVQVHPDNEQARSRGLLTGKEECWVVVDAEADASVGLGLKCEVSPESLREAALSGEIEELLEWWPARRGDWFFVPAGTVHAIGAGLQLVEIQQHSDITYRLYDYGRPRELHLDDGIAVALRSLYEGPYGSLLSEPVVEPFVACSSFSIAFHRGQSSMALRHREAIVLPIGGAYRVDGRLLEVGQVGYGRSEELVAVEEQASGVLVAYPT